MNDWALKKTSLILITVSILLSLFFAKEAKTQQKDDKSTVTIELQGGRNKNFLSPINIKGKFKCENFTISHLSIEKIESILFIQKQKSENIFVIKLRDAEKTIQGFFSGDAEITGSGEWGKETVAMSTIRSIKISNEGATKPFKPESRWHCIFKNGDQLAIGWASKWSGDSEFLGSIGDGSLNLDIQQVAKLYKSGDLWSISSNDGFSLEGWQPKKESLSTSSPFGGLELTWSKVTELSNESTSFGDSGKKSNTLHPKDWKVEISGRFVLPVSELQTGKKAMINGEIDVKSINWQFIDSTSRKPTGLQINLSNKKCWMLQDSILGNCPVGKVEVPIQHVTKLERLTPFPKNRIPSDYNKGIVATITTVSGSEYAVGDPSLEGGTAVDDDKDFFGYRLFRVSTPPVEMWISSDSLLTGEFSIVDGKIVSHSQMLERFGPLGGFTRIKFSNPGGEFVLHLAKLAKYSPQSSTPQLSASASQKPKYRVMVKDEAGREFSGEVFDIKFARYPKLGWVGSYPKSTYPFQWHRANSLYFKKESGERIDVEFSKLKKIHISGNYGSSRPATLTSVRGTQIKGSIYPGDVAKKYPGTSDWNPDKEGLLLGMVDATYVYVPFRKGEIIEIQQISQE